LWALVPLEEPMTDESAPVRRRAPVAAALAIASTVAAVTASATLVTNEATATIALLVVIATSGGAVAWSLGFDRSDPSWSTSYRLWTRVGASVILLLAGAVSLLSRPSAINAVLGVGMVVLGVGVLAAPRIVSLWTDLLAERTARVREVQRAEIAAHLHDSVLQTLALIQNRAGASSEVARIARAQERELRDWLFAGDEAAASDLATELRGIAAAIELDLPARIEVVAAGESIAAPTPLVAAAREAMLNAARHAGGEVSVYVESSPDAIDVFVRDRGAGVSIGDIPADRLGIRESIIGRMTRAGGSATVGSAPGGTGTEVHLHLEVSDD
jgi:signal transduction histidine kinase